MTDLSKHRITNILKVRRHIACPLFYKGKLSIHSIVFFTWIYSKSKQNMLQPVCHIPSNKFVWKNHVKILLYPCVRSKFPHQCVQIIIQLFIILYRIKCLGLNHLTSIYKIVTDCLTQLQCIFRGKNLW